MRSSLCLAVCLLAMTASLFAAEPDIYSIPLKDIKTFKDDPAAVEQQGASIKTRYTRIFRV